MRQIAWIITFSSLLVFACSLVNRDARLKDQGNKIVAKIDAFNNKNKRLPNSLSEIGIEEKLEGPIYYQKVTDTKYVVWFGKELGESETFDSDTRQWEP
jgi:hypothetical protein